MGNKRHLVGEDITHHLYQAFKGDDSEVIVLT